MSVSSTTGCWNISSAIFLSLQLRTPQLQRAEQCIHRVEASEVPQLRRMSRIAGWSFSSTIRATLLRLTQLPDRISTILPAISEMWKMIRGTHKPGFQHAVRHRNQSGKIEARRRLSNQRSRSPRTHFSYDTDDKLLNAVNGDLDLFSTTPILNIRWIPPVLVCRYPGTSFSITQKIKINTTRKKISQQATRWLIFIHIQNAVCGWCAIRNYQKLSVVSQDSTLDRGNIDEQDWLPSAKLVYQLTSNMNLRLAATQTLARPNFREIALLTKEFVGGFEFAGNPNLKRTLIQNYDLRWEWFKRRKPGRWLSQRFYKRWKTRLNGHSRKVWPLPTASKRWKMWAKTLYGIELETRVNMDFVAPKLRNFSVGGELIAGSIYRKCAGCWSWQTVAVWTPTPTIPAHCKVNHRIFSTSICLRQPDERFQLRQSVFQHPRWAAREKSPEISPRCLRTTVQPVELYVSQRILQQVSAKFAVKTSSIPHMKPIISTAAKRFTGNTNREPASLWEFLTKCSFKQLLRTDPGAMW